MTPSRRLQWALTYVAVVMGLGLLSAIDVDGLRKHLRLDVEVNRATIQNELLIIENARLRREARALERDPAALERAAREELGYVRPGEWIYKLDEPEASP